MSDRMPVGYRGITWLMILLGAVVMVISIQGCAVRQGPPKSENIPVPSQESEDGRLLVIATIFPYCGSARQTAGDKVKLKLMVPTGMGSHSFEPMPADMIATQEADMLICNGGEIEQRVKKVLGSLDTSHTRVLTMMGHVDTMEEEHMEDMEKNEHHHEDVYERDGHEKDNHEEESGHEIHIEYDEHIWTSPANAQVTVKIISRTLAEAAPGERSRFEVNTQAYLQKLEGLDSQSKQVADQGRSHMIVVTDELPFRYLADEHGFSYRAAFSRCSGDTEPNASTITYLIDKVEGDWIPAVYYPELSNYRTAEVVQEGTGATPLLLYFYHNMTKKQFDRGITYLQLMKQNMENLRYGLE